MVMRLVTRSAVALLVLGILGLGFVGHLVVPALYLTGETSVAALGRACAEPTITYNPISSVMSVDESQTLTFTMSNPALVESCGVSVQFSADRFDVSPQQTQIQVSLPPSGTARFTWTIAPKQVGTYQVWLMANDAQQNIGITVTDALGLDAAKVQLLGYASAIASLVGILVTVVSAVRWVYKRLRR